MFGSSCECANPFRGNANRLATLLVSSLHFYRGKQNVLSCHSVKGSSSVNGRCVVGSPCALKQTISLRRTCPLGNITREKAILQFV